MGIVKAIRIIVHGRVQGVFFRHNVSEFCKSKSITGTIKNDSNGTVKLLFFGTNSNFEELKLYIKNNPGKSSVTKIETEEINHKDIIDELERIDSFRIIG